MKKPTSLALALLLWFLLAPASLAQASVQVQGTQPGLEARLYYLGAWSQGRLLPAPDLADLAQPAGGWAPADLESPAVQDQILHQLARRPLQPQARATANAGGRLVLPLDREGAYLVTYGRLLLGDQVLLTRPSFFTYGGGGDLKLVPKADLLPEEDLKSLDLVKVWAGDSPRSRPEQITVHLYEAGQLQDSRTLTAQEGWRTRWTGLDPKKAYTLVEEVPTGYRSQLSGRPGFFYLTNTRLDPAGPSPSPPQEPGFGDRPQAGLQPSPPGDGASGSQPGLGPDAPADPGILGPADQLAQPRLPQTGQLWWPLPLLLGASLGLVLWDRKKNLAGQPKTYRWASRTCLALALGLVLWNSWEDQQAQTLNHQALQALAPGPQVEASPAPEAEPQPLACREIDGIDFIGHLALPSLAKDLPVTRSWNQDLLQAYPNLYWGQDQGDPLVIMAHNYRSTFGGLGRLQEGDPATLTDVLGQTRTYTVAAKEILPAGAVEEMIQGAWPLTLFTCTLDGQARLTVRLVEGP